MGQRKSIAQRACLIAWNTKCEADRLKFFVAANRVRVIGSRNPLGLFVRIVRSGLWSFLTQDDEDNAARAVLRRIL